MPIAFVGNFQPEHSTENELLRALTNNGEEVICYQEGSEAALHTLIETHLNAPLDEPIDFVLWTRTGGLAKPHEALYWEILTRAHRMHTPVIGYHLDRWWGLKEHGREAEIRTDPYFAVDLLVTADGGHDDYWDHIGVSHLWMPPGVSRRHCRPGEPRDHFRSKVAFVGSWQPGYHSEWSHRSDLVRFLRKTYGRDVEFWPKKGQHAVRGSDLNDLYWSTDVVVGDSCLVPRPDGTPMTRYCSDRVPETMGRGGNLLHPLVEGINGTVDDPFWIAGLPTWELGNFDDLKRTIDELLDESAEDRMDRRIAGITHVAQQHTYENRMADLCDIVRMDDNEWS